MRDDVILDAVVDLVRDDAFVEQVVLSAIRSIANDARRPGARHPWRLHQFFKACGVDVDPRFRRRCALRTRGWPHSLIRESHASRRQYVAHRYRQQRPWEQPFSHLSIVRPAEEAVNPWFESVGKQQDSVRCFLQK
jgi:hypothetical protein